MSAPPSKVPTPSGGANERQPLLQTDPITPQEVEEDHVPEYIERGEAEEATKVEELTWRWYTFYGVLFLAGLVAMSLLIKGFIESGDKDVSAHSRLESTIILTLQISLT